MSIDLTKIKMFIMDVDGTLTDGKIYIGNDGEAMKAFNPKDGLGIKLLIKHDIMPLLRDALLKSSAAAVRKSVSKSFFRVSQKRRKK